MSGRRMARRGRVLRAGRADGRRPWRRHQRKCRPPRPRGAGYWPLRPASDAGHSAARQPAAIPPRSLWRPSSTRADTTSDASMTSVTGDPRRGAREFGPAARMSLSRSSGTGSARPASRHRAGVLARRALSEGIPGGTGRSVRRGRPGHPVSRPVRHESVIGSGHACMTQLLLPYCKQCSRRGASFGSHDQRRVCPCPGRDGSATKIVQPATRQDHGCV